MSEVVFRVAVVVPLSVFAAAATAAAVAVGRGVVCLRVDVAVSLAERGVVARQVVVAREAGSVRVIVAIEGRATAV